MPNSQPGKFVVARDPEAKRALGALVERDIKRLPMVPRGLRAWPSCP